MLKLQRIELHGFKSFYDRCEIDISDTGVTAIVGPNGCGKSNISDAIAWVLGTQSPKSLRGEKMEDVIFSGTRQRLPLGMAAVMITLADTNPPHSNGGPPPGPRQVIVERRLYRSGESIYLIDGKPCRLRDIQDIFLGTGLGPQNYAIIEQGRIGQLLSSRPTDRRALIEEAAGITKFKAKRKLTESRLEAARQNLARVNDILVEVDRQRNSLKRQASKARRYMDLRKHMHRILYAVFSTRAELLIEQQDNVEAALRAIAGEGEQLERDIAELSRLVHRHRADVEKKQKELEQTHEQHSEAGLEYEKSIQRIDRMRDQVNVLQEKQAALGEEKTKTLDDLERNQGEQECKAVQLREVEETIFGIRQSLEHKNVSLAELTQRRQQEDRAIEQLRKEQFEIVGREAQVRNQVSTRREMLLRLGAQLDRLQREQEAARTVRQNLEAEFRAAEQEQFSQQAGLAGLTDRLAEAENAHSSNKAAHADAVKAAAEAKSQEDNVRNRLETIRELAANRAYSTGTVQQFFNHLQSGTWSPVGIVADFVEVDPEYETVVEDLLRAELEYVVVEDWSHAENALQVVKNVTKGRLDCLVLNGNGTAHSNGGPISIDGAVPVASVVRVHERIREFAPHLHDAYIVDDVRRAWELAGQHPKLVFVARTGEVVRGRVIGWGERSTHGPLSLKRELRELERTIDAAAGEAADAAGLVQALERLVEESEQSRIELARTLQEAEKTILTTSHRVRALASELGHAEQQWKVARTEIERFDEERRELVKAIADAESELSGISARKSAMDAEVQSRSEKSEHLRLESEAISKDIADLRSRLAVLDERRSTFVRELSALKQLAGELDERLRRTDRQIVQAREQRDQTDGAIRALEETCSRLLEERRRLEAAVSAGQQALEALKQELQEAETRWDEARSLLDSWKDRQNQLEIEKTQVDSDLRHLAALCLSEMGETIESVCLRTSETLAPEELDRREQEYREMREKLDAMAPVNMMAVEEYQEAEDRFQFLTAQRQDLLDSIRDTTQAIEEIDAVCRNQFKEAFDEINARFRVAFVALFGGGHGELRLIDEAEESEAGIEIIAQPPGKKLQNILLLSGGEKALAALALLIALFRFKPSPFCVLDEVDAPLDDANVDRFAQTILEMSDRTQFIIITHSKRTMEVAKTLYGVTMEEPGISKIVSVRLN